MNEIKIFSPATIANISCGFDVLGLALDNVGDEMIIRKSDEKGVRITKIVGQKLPLEAHLNVAGIAAMALLSKVDIDYGFEIEIYKNIKPGSGIGSSAASAAGAVWAINQLLDAPFTSAELVKFAMEGEKLSSGIAHADNVAPALLGGITLVRSYEPLDLINLNVPKNLVVTVIHPQIEVKTATAREILRSHVTLKDAIAQWGNVAGLVSGLFMEDYDLIGRSLEDKIVEPVRSILIPAYDAVVKSSKMAGALGCGISGSGPSIFALSKGASDAENVKVAMKQVYDKIGIPYDIHISSINPSGIKKL